MELIHIHSLGHNVLNACLLLGGDVYFKNGLLFHFSANGCCRPISGKVFQDSIFHKMEDVL